MRLNLREGLRRLGARSGDILMVHASLRALGLARSQGVERGAELVVSALDAAVGPVLPPPRNPPATATGFPIRFAPVRFR
jgi:aminoglycoside N3'-acetyltransferase